MRLLLVLAAALLAGCASPAPSGLIEAPIGRDPIVEGGCAGNCSWQWWNLSVEAEGAWVATIPLPIRFGEPGPPRMAEYARAWAGRIALAGGTARVGASDEGAWVNLSGTDAVTARGALMLVAAQGETADAFLLARWGPGATDTRPERIVVPPPLGDVRDVRLVYDARSDLCWRHAAYSLVGRGDDGSLLLDGADVAGCA